MSQKPTALLLADLFESFNKSSHELDGIPVHLAAAAEMRSLYALNAELAAALGGAIDLIEMLDGKDNSCDPKSDISDLRAALANHHKQTGEQA